MNIKKAIISTSHKQGSLIGLYNKDISAKLGFEPEGLSCDEKSRFSWEFIVDGQECSVWDWHGSCDTGRWSFYGPQEVFVNLFGQKHVAL